MLNAKRISMGFAALLLAAWLPADSDEGFTYIFKGDDLSGWRMAGPGAFVLEDGALKTSGGMGLLWYGEKMYGDFVLRVEWKVSRKEDNSGIFVRFPGISNDPWFAVNHGYEIQIDDVQKDSARRTGAIYSFKASEKLASKPAGEWNLYEITVVGQRYTVVLNGQKVTEFEGNRGRRGFIGLQNHDEKSAVYFRNIRIKEL